MAVRWHPILDAVEVEPGVWHLVDQWQKPYAIVRLVEIGGERGYRATTWAEQSSDRQLLGYWRTAKAAIGGAHQAWIHTRSGPGFTGYPEHLGPHTSRE